jgi:superfamily II DNA or RNA helicase
MENNNNVTTNEEENEIDNNINENQTTDEEEDGERVEDEVEDNSNDETTNDEEDGDRVENNNETTNNEEEDRRVGAEPYVNDGERVEDEENEDTSPQQNSPKTPTLKYTPIDRLSFPHWVFETFKQFKLGKDDEKPKRGVFKPMKYQRFLKEFMNPISPYRGILLYHGLGSGKTCTAIGIGEQFKSTKNIVVMLPASLRGNFIHKGLEFCGDPKYKENPDLYKNKYTFVSYNASNTPDQIKRLGNLDNKVIIIEEAHNLVSMMVGGVLGNNKNGRFIYDSLMTAKNSNIIALTGTPVQNDQYEIALLMNVLRGFIEVMQFGITRVGRKYGDSWDFKEIKEDIEKLDEVDYVKVDTVAKNIEVHCIYKSYDPKYQEVIRKIMDLGNRHDTTVKFIITEEITLFPEDPDVFDNFYIKQNVYGDSLRDPDVFKKRIMGLVSFYELDKNDYPEVKFEKYFRVPMSKYQTEYYNFLREKEKKGESSSGRGGKRKRGGGVKGTFRVYTRQASNFAFPEEIPRPFKDPKFKVFQKKDNKKEILKFNKAIKQEEQIDEGNAEIDKKYKMRQDKALAKLVKEQSKYLTPKGLETLSPKMLEILNNINESPGLVFVYSNFRTMEGVGVFSKILDANGYAPFGTDNDLPKYAIYSGMEDEDVKNQLIEVFTSPSNAMGQRIKIIMATSAGAEGLDLKNIRQIHIMDPYWNEMRNRQVIGRGVRRDSHIDLPKSERNVSIYRYLSVFAHQTSPSKKEGKNVKIDVKKMATDEYLDYSAQKKQQIINEILLCLKEASVDCLLNREAIEEEYECLDFGDADELAYETKFSKDVAIKTKKKKITYVPGLIWQGKVYAVDTKDKKVYLASDKKKKGIDQKALKKDKRGIEKVFLNMDEGDVYNRTSVKDKKSKIIGSYDKLGDYKSN